MKRVLFSALALICLSGGFAQASPVNSEDLILLNTSLSNYGSSITYGHDMTSPTSGPAFNPLTDTALSADLCVQFRDDWSLRFLFCRETVQVFEDGNLVDTRVIPDSIWEIPYFGTEFEDFSVNVAYIQDNGVLDVTLSALVPDFCVVSSKLRLTFEPGSDNGSPGAPVPEPATLTLLAIGAAASLMASRRKI